MYNIKLKFLKDYFKGKRYKLPSYMYMHIKTIKWSAETPDRYFDDDDKTSIYTIEQVAEIEKQFCVILIYYVKTPEEIPISEEEVRKLKELTGEKEIIEYQ